MPDGKVTSLRKVPNRKEAARSWATEVRPQILVHTDTIQDRDDLADQVERSERVNEIAELRDQHMRETVELRRKFHAAQAATLEEA